METRANYVVIGLFTLAVIAGVFGFVYWFQTVSGTGERAYYRVVFDGSVSGLRTGGNVLFNGIRVGEVTGLTLDPQHPQQVTATIAIDKAVAVRPDTQISMEFQGLTGIASLSLKGGDPTKPALIGSKEDPPVLTAPPNATTDVTQSAREVLAKLNEVLEQNQAPLHQSLENLAKLTDALARNSGRIDQITAGLQDLTGGADGKGGKINEAAQSIKTLADHLDQRTAEITTNINRLAASGARQIEQLSSNAQRTLSTINRAVDNLDRNPSRLIFGGSGSSLPEYKGRR